MSEQSKIAWCDSTVNFWSGCTKVSAGCAHCYAEARDKRHMTEDKDHWGKGAPRLKQKGAVKDALALNRKPWICPNGHQPMNGAPGGHGPYSGDVMKTETPCCECGAMLYRRRIFSLSLGDWLDAEVPIEWLAEMLDTIRQCDQVTWILCTKRPELFFDRLNHVMASANEDAFYSNSVRCGDLGIWLDDWLRKESPPKNIIILTSVENQATAHQRIPELLKIPAACRGLSVEPLLGPIDLTNLFVADYLAMGFQGEIAWAIFGGESGDKARPCNVQWIRDGLKQCQAAGVPAFVKQIGRDPQWSDQDMAERWYEKLSHPKGGDPAEWPADLRVREFPNV